jgi:hypothetical protein
LTETLGILAEFVGDPVVVVISHWSREQQAPVHEDDRLAVLASALALVGIAFQCAISIDYSTDHSTLESLRHSTIAAAQLCVGRIVNINVQPNHGVGLNYEIVSLATTIGVTLVGPQVELVLETVVTIQLFKLGELDITTSSITLGGAVVRLLEARTERSRLYSHRPVRACDRHVIYNVHDASSMLLFPVVVSCCCFLLFLLLVVEVLLLLLLLLCCSSSFENYEPQSDGAFGAVGGGAGLSGLEF